MIILTAPEKYNIHNIRLCLYVDDDRCCQKNYTGREISQKRFGGGSVHLEMGLANGFKLRPKNNLNLFRYN